MIRIRLLLSLFLLSSSLLASRIDTEVEKLSHSLLQDLRNEKLEFFHILREVNQSGAEVVLEDLSKWRIGWWYRGVTPAWQKGDRLKISFHPEYSNNIHIENIDHHSEAWGILEALPAGSTSLFIHRLSNKTPLKVTLNAGLILKSPFENFSEELSAWQIDERIFLFHNGDTYDLWNFDRGAISTHWSLISLGKPSTQIKRILQLEPRLNQKVLGQKEACHALATSILNYTSGLKDPTTPIGVFLFIGPTGVGKTELAKALAEELFQDRNALIHLDMSHYTDHATLTRLVGSPPGYYDHEAGGQLAEAIKEKPRSIVLLDEMEKAHTQVHKFFLPLFDEAEFIDAKGQKIDCRNVIFIMTTNLCAKEIASLYAQGYESFEILGRLESRLMEALTPELYNRLEPIIFYPLEEEIMVSLVDMMLKRLVKRLKTMRDMTLLIDESVKSYLIENGFHPTLGARPLRNLIQKTIVAALSYAIVSENIPSGSTLALSYDSRKDSFSVNWEP